MNVLIFPAATEIAAEMRRSLQYSKHFKIIGASSDPSTDYGFEKYIGNIPDVSHPQFVKHFQKIVQDNKIKLILPAHDDAILTLAENAAAFLPARVVAPPLVTCAICRSKAKTYATFPGIAPAETTNYPMFAKPDIGNASRGVRVIHNEEELNALPDGYVVREYLPGDEYTVDCFTDQSGVLIFARARARTKTNAGIAVDTIAIAEPHAVEMAEYINDTLLMRGAWFFQVKRDRNGRLKLLEIAPRIGGSSGLWHAVGVNLVELSLWDAIGEQVRIIHNGINARMTRRLDCRYTLPIKYDAAYIDLDDTILDENGYVRPIMAAFIAQCERNKIKIRILTKGETVAPWLIKHIPCVKCEGVKSAYITPENAIFIDDSFAERREVSESLGIPVFDVAGVRALLNFQ